ncbi:MAG: hypothetical protein ABFS02_12715 [Pseudomonadota bacterium]
MIEYVDEIWAKLETHPAMARYWETLKNSGISDDKGHHFLDRAWLCAVQEQEMPGFLREWRLGIDRPIKHIDVASSLTDDERIILATSTKRLDNLWDIATYLDLIATEVFDRQLHDAVAIVVSVLFDEEIDTERLKRAIDERLSELSNQNPPGKQDDNE